MNKHRQFILNDMIQDSAYKRLYDILSEFPVGKLEAIYNDAWRKAHNGIDVELSDIKKAFILVIAFERAHHITGTGGNWQIVPMLSQYKKSTSQ